MSAGRGPWRLIYQDRGAFARPLMRGHSIPRKVASMEPVRFPNVKPPSPGESVRVDVKGVAVAVFNVEGALCAIEARCTHRGGPLEKGPVTGTVVTCPWHGSQFDLKSGEVVRGPATVPERSFPVKLDGDTLVVEAP
jgi:nitrite reductase/ring-hydroxylating ferredoxin subunit